MTANEHFEQELTNKATVTHYKQESIIMLRTISSILLFAAVASFAAQGSGIFFEAHFSQGKMRGDSLVHFPGQRIGYTMGDTIRFILDGKEDADTNRYKRPFTSYPVEFQYAVRHAFVAGYEKSFNKVLSIRGAIGYQYAFMDAYAATINKDMSESPLVDAQIERHWLTIPIDFKVTLPIRRGGLYIAMGPKSSILLASKYTDNISGNTEDLGDLTPRFNLGLGFRFGTELAIAKIGFLLIESGYNWGLLNTAIITAAKSREGEFSLLALGFRINFPKK